MVAAQDLGSCDFGRVGSSPISRTCDYSVFLDFPTFLLHRGSIKIDVFHHELCPQCAHELPDMPTRGIREQGTASTPPPASSAKRHPYMLPAASTAVKRHSAPRAHDPREHRFYRFFSVACHCRDWNTVAIHEGMGYPHTSSPIAPTSKPPYYGGLWAPSHVFSHCPNSTTKHRRVWGTPTRLLPLLPIQRVPPREVSGRQAKPAKRQFRVPPRARKLLKQCGYYPRWARVAQKVTARGQKVTLCR